MSFLPITLHTYRRLSQNLSLVLEEWLAKYTLRGVLRRGDVTSIES